MQCHESSLVTPGPQRLPSVTFCQPPILSSSYFVSHSSSFFHITSYYNFYQVTSTFPPLYLSATISIKWVSFPTIYPGLKKMFISREAVQFFPQFVECFYVQKDKISHQIPKFPTKHQHFPGRSFPISTLFSHHDHLDKL